MKIETTLSNKNLLNARAELDGMLSRRLHTRSKKRFRQFKKNHPWYSPTSIQKFIKFIHPEWTLLVDEMMDADFWISPQDDYTAYQKRQRRGYERIANSFSDTDWEDFNIFIRWYAEMLLYKGVTIYETRKEIYDQLIALTELSDIPTHWADVMGRFLPSWWD